MDKQILVTAVTPFFNALENMGWQVTDYRVMPAYEHFRSEPLLLGIVIPAMINKSVPDRVRLTIPVLRENVSADSRDLISGLLIYDSAAAMNHDMDEREGVGRPVVEPYWTD